MDIALDKVCDFIERARALDAKEGVTDPDSGSNPTDDGEIDALTTTPDDPVEQELRDVITGSTTTSAPISSPSSMSAAATSRRRNGRTRCASPASARRQARLPTADWLVGIPNLGDLLDEGLAAMGRSCA